MALLESVLQRDSTEQVKHAREEMERKHKKKVEEIEQEHEKALENLLEQFSRIHELEEEVGKGRKQVKKLEKHIAKLKVELKSKHSSHLNTEAELLQKQIELDRFKAEFQRKVDETKDQLKNRLDDLMLENCQLRKKFLSKSEEMSQYRADVECSGAKIISSYKEKVHVMIKARRRANLSLAMGLTEDVLPSNPMPRPSSAPTTRAESSRVRRSIQSAEQSKESSRVTNATARPKSCLADFDHKYHH